MRIRSIRPEFWSSEDVAAMDWNTRLVYIGLWSYVDDNGVGRDLERLIVSDLFPLDESLSESSLRVHGALKHLKTAGHITRYKVNGKPYLHITAWETHQKINRPSPGRYPLPTSGNTDPHDVLTEPSVSPHSTLSAGEGEKGRRGEGEKTTTSSTPAASKEFDDWYTHYPRKVGKQAAAKAYTKARKTQSAAQLLVAVRRFATDPNLNPDHKYIPHPATWLNEGRWDDDPMPALNAPQAPPQRPGEGVWGKRVTDPYGLEGDTQ